MKPQSASPNRVQAVRQSLPAVLSQVYLNTGTAGPLPEPVAAAIVDFTRDQLAQGRANPLLYGRYEQLAEQVRYELARFIGADADEIALTHHTTDGLNLVIWGLPWQPGDWVLTTNLEHEGALLPLYELHRRRGVALRFAHLGLGERETALAALRRSFGGDMPPTTPTPGASGASDRPAPIRGAGRPPRLLVLSHVSFSSGALLPLAEIVALAHQHGTQVLVDGAQSVGVVPVDVHQLQVDYYAFPGQKWLCGPEGTGGLYVRRDHWAELEPTLLGWAAVAELPGVGPAYASDSPFFLPAAGARRYETGTVFPPGIAGLAAALRWRRQEVGEEWAISRIQQLVRYAREQLLCVPGLEVLTPASGARPGLTSEPGSASDSGPRSDLDLRSGLLHFRPVSPQASVTAEPAAIAQWVRALLDHQFIVRSIREPASIRLSVSFFNTEDEIDRLVATVADLTHESRE